MGWVWCVACRTCFLVVGVCDDGECCECDGDDGGEGDGVDLFVCLVVGVWLFFGVFVLVGCFDGDECAYYC